MASLIPFFNVHLLTPFHSCMFLLSTYHMLRVVLGVLGQKGSCLGGLSFPLGLQIPPP